MVIIFGYDNVYIDILQINLFIAFIHLFIYTLYYMKNCLQCAIFWVPKMNKTPGSK